MTQNKNKAAMRYAARLACIYDWSAYQDMDRPVEKLSKKDCMEAITALSRLTDPLALKLWSIVGDLYPGIGNNDIEQAEKWILPELDKAYSKQKREINAVQRLREVFRSEGISMMDLQQQTGEPYLNFMRWTRFQTHIPDLMVQAVESLDAAGKPWRTADAFRERDRIRRRYEDTARTEKS